MSYDISATCQHCKSVLVHWDPTYNYSKMFAALGIHPRDFVGRPSREYGNALGAASVKLRADLSEYAKLDADNGWGTAAQLLEVIEEMARRFERAGDAIMDL